MDAHAEYMDEGGVPVTNGYLGALGVIALLATVGVLVAAAVTGVLFEVFVFQWVVMIGLALGLNAVGLGLFLLGGWQRAARWSGGILAVNYLNVIIAVYLWIGWEQTPGGMPLGLYVGRVAVWCALAGLGIFLLHLFKKPTKMTPWLAALLQRDKPAPPRSEKVPLRFYLLRFYAYLFGVLGLIYAVGFVGWHYTLFRPAGRPPLTVEPLVLLGEVVLVAIAGLFFLQIYLYADEKLARERQRERRAATKLAPRPDWSEQKHKRPTVYRLTIRHPRDVPVEVSWDVDDRAEGEPGRRETTPRRRPR